MLPFSIDKIFRRRDEGQQPSRSLFRRLFVDDWVIKAVALGITLALWLGVTGLRVPSNARFKNIALNLRVSNNIDVTYSSDEEVEVSVTGDKRKIDQINPRDLVVLLDLTDIPAGERGIKLNPESVGVELPAGVRLEEIQPSQIQVNLETVEEGEVPVKIETEGALAENFELYSSAVSPAKVRVRGPSSFVKSLDSVSTEKINVDNRQADFAVQQVELNLVNPKITLLDTIVGVTLKIGEKRGEKVFSVPLKIENQSKIATVVLYGARSDLEFIKRENLHVEIFKNDAGENSPRLILPVDVQERIEIKKLKIN
jgi:YbbR domain-containing protein